MTEAERSLPAPCRAVAAVALPGPGPQDSPQGEVAAGRHLGWACCLHEESRKESVYHQNYTDVNLTDCYNVRCSWYLPGRPLRKQQKISTERNGEGIQMPSLRVFL